MKPEKKGLYLGALGALVVVLLIAGVSPVYLLVLACPVSMMFMMKGMGHGSNHSSEHSKAEHDHER
jgi:hypothetical protein